MADIYTEYDCFAYFYNKYWTINAPLYLEKALDILLLEKLEEKAHILDVCCGTGNVAGLLSERGYNMTGLDGSKLMLDYAKENAPAVEFVQADARDFNLGRKFQAITCLFDSINHLLSKDDVLLVFKNIYEHLEENGIFVFDTNSLSSSEDVDLSDFSAVEEQEVFISQGSYNSIEKLTTYFLTAFVKENNKWERYDNKIYERYYEEELLISILKKAGFRNTAYTYGADIEIEPFEDRVFFTAWK
ncbi:class I SAM-dependent methyltransferase [uncultured Brachyspira sp.]|uniref:class I SAM-dependent DNA methyltransferase n=1 Tax=uncultured Brachyspira sp. TaxID=221953 RepID=UPI002622BE55|nr:class I SAM-dependent methyltransferase [uncultured Brachyspira sp.]